MSRWTTLLCFVFLSELASGATIDGASGQNGPQFPAAQAEAAPDGSIYSVVNIFAVQTTINSNVWDLSVSNNTTTGLSAFSFLTSAYTFSFTADSGISASLDPALSGLFLNPAPTGLADAQILRITGAASGSVGTIIVAAGAQNVKLGVITTNRLLVLRDCDDLCGGTAFDNTGKAVVPWTITTDPGPEPASLLLVGLGLFSVALIRRRAA